jgi:hypothetical protein
MGTPCASDVTEAGALQRLGDVMGGRLAIDGGIERQDHLAHAFGGDPVDQAGNVQVLGSDIVERPKAFRPGRGSAP